MNINVKCAKESIVFKEFGLQIQKILPFSWGYKNAISWKNNFLIPDVGLSYLSRIPLWTWFEFLNSYSSRCSRWDHRTSWFFTGWLCKEEMSEGFDLSECVITECQGMKFTCDGWVQGQCQLHWVYYGSCNMNGFLLQVWQLWRQKIKITRSFMKAGLAGKARKHVAGQDLSRSGR